jgi:hypothetical protein
MFTRDNNFSVSWPFRRRFPALFATGFVLGQVAFLCGCSVIPKPPAPMAPFVQGDEIFGQTPHLAGSYANLGQAFTDKGDSLGPVLLSAVLSIDRSEASSWRGGSSTNVQPLLGSATTNVTADRVTITEPEAEVVEMRFCKQEQSLAVRRFSRYTWSRATGGHGIFGSWDGNKDGSPFYAVKGFLDVPLRDRHGGGGMVPAFYAEGEESLLRKSTDGSLIVLQRKQVVGAMAIIPFWSNHYVWCCFPPLDIKSPFPH